MKRNPFEYGRELGLSELVDRAVELGVIEATIRNRAKLFLIGPRRYGKTSLLSAAGEAAERSGAIVIRVDAEKYESLNLLAAALLTAATRALQGPLERAIESVRKAAGRLRPTVSMDGESISVSLGVEASAEPLPVLTDALDAIEELAAGQDDPVVVVLDEVQAVVVEHGIAAERQLRSTVQRHRHTAYVFAGSDTRLLNEMTSAANRPFYRIGSRLFLDALPREDFIAFLDAAFGNTGFDPGGDVAPRILELAQEVPYNVQRLAHETWEMARAHGRTELEAGLVDEALRRIVLREDPAYTQIWSQLTGNQKKALKAVIMTEGRQPLSGEVTRALRIPASSLQTALTALQRAHLVRTEAAQGETRYRLVDPFFADWLRVSQG